MAAALPDAQVVPETSKDDSEVEMKNIDSLSTEKTIVDCVKTEQLMETDAIVSQQPMEKTDADITKQPKEKADVDAKSVGKADVDITKQPKEGADADVQPDGKADVDITKQPKEGADVDLQPAEKSDATKTEKSHDTQKGGSSNATDGNLYGYIDKDFTSEVYKIEITHLPQRYGIGEFKKRMINLGLKPNKIKVSADYKFAFVNFRCEEDRQAALVACNGHRWKGQIWKAKVAKPAADPLLKKRQLERENGSANKKAKLEEDTLSPSEQLQKAVTPLAHLSYDEQIEQKKKELEKAFLSIGTQIQKHSGQVPEILTGPINLTRSPIEKDYRNKAEMTIGTSPDGEEKVVGFRLGSYKNASVHVVSPEDCVHIPSQMKDLAKVFQKYLQTVSKYAAFNPVTRDGHWKQIMLRTTETGQCMVVPQFHPQSLSQEDIDAEKDSMKDYFQNGDGKNCKITSLYFQVQKDRGAPISTEVVLGEKDIVETMLEMKFRVSPESFFQVNTRAAEVLYTKIGDLCQLDKNVVFFDICCGTGTIGLSVAKRVRKVIGIEMVQEAIDDAKENAKLNGIENIEFICAKAEDQIFQDKLKEHINSAEGTRCVVVVDPPRSGLHPSVIIRLRQLSHQISDVVYVACNPLAASGNLVDLTRTVSNRVRGSPYVLTQVIGVDMFPSTSHVEAVFHFKGIDLEKGSNEGDS